MSVKKSISLTESQDSYATSLVDEGRFPSLSAVMQHGLEMMRERSQATEALKELLEQRRSETFVGMDEGMRRTQDMLARKRAERGL
jgi:antitoxin ParD1/3/4